MPTNISTKGKLHEDHDMYTGWRSDTGSASQYKSLMHIEPAAAQRVLWQYYTI